MSTAFFGKNRKYIFVRYISNLTIRWNLSILNFDKKIAVCYYSTCFMRPKCGERWAYFIAIQMPGHMYVLVESSVSDKKGINVLWTWFFDNNNFGSIDPIKQQKMNR